MEGYSEIYMMKVDGKGVINLTNNGIDDYLIDVSKDGLNVFYEAFKEDGKAELLMYDLKSSRTVLIMEIDPEAHYN